MRKVTYFKRTQLLKRTARKFKKARVVLDIGCGIRPQNYIVPQVHICCEPYIEYVNKLKETAQKAGDRTYVIIHAGWDEAVSLIPERSVDTVFLLDVIEHLAKGKGKKLLKKTEKLACKQMILFTPLGFMPQSHPDGIDAWGLKGVSMQEHKSGWLPEDFDDSWDIYACTDFHQADHKGKKFDKPFGALWAVKNIDYKGYRLSFSLRTFLHQMIDSVFNFINYYTGLGVRVIKKAGSFLSGKKA